MDAREATANNDDLWARYLFEQWSAWLDPLGLRRIAGVDEIARAIADAAAAGVAAWLTILYAQPIGRLYSANEATVTRFVAELTIAAETIEIAAQYTERHALPRYDRYDGETQRESLSAREVVGASER